MGKRLFVCVIYDDMIRPSFVQQWTKLHEELLSQKFSVSLSFGISSLQSIPEECDYVLILHSNVLFEFEHFISMFYKMYDKDILGGVVKINDKTINAIEAIENGVYMTADELKEKSSPFKVDCASFEWTLLKQTTFEILRKQETYKLVPFSSTDTDGKPIEDVLPPVTSIFIRLKEAGLSCWIDPSVQVKRISMTLI